ncbi:MAG: flagellar hook protein FlgE [Alphaproteobacteria bacterium]|jgi:flagellar hook protein FlgE|nr:flagellar hook protein FlgE [Alphaproteobacteria bacterium]
MSLYGAMVSGILGLQAQTQQMGMISDNISNVNTVGYKRSAAQFSTLITDAPTATSYTPGGVQARPRQFVSNQGVLATSSNTTDMGIQGNGFFVVSTLPVTGPANGGPATPTSGATIGYTRAGNFTVDANGNLRNASGYYLQGWPAIPPNNTAFANSQTIQQLRTVNVAGLSGNAVPTANITARVNLQASTAINATYTGAGATGMLQYINSGGATGIAPNFQRTFQVYDSQGTARGVTFAFLKTAANTWSVEAMADLDGNGTQDLINTPPQTINFNTDGTLNRTTSTFLTNNSPMVVNWAAALGITTPQNIALNFGTNGLADGFTQFDSASALINSTVDGSVSGTFTGVSINDQGVVQALFDNGTRRNIYQIPVVTFINPDGLQSGQGNLYLETQASGTGNINVAGTGGAGFTKANQLEQSNVDLATEFTNMIVTQRAYSANGKTIQTADEMLTEIINLKR